MTKAHLRKTYKVLRENLSLNDIDNLSLQIANMLLKLPVWDYTFYHLFLSIKEQKEIDTDFILNILSGKDKNIVLSKSDFKTGKMINYLLTDNTIIKKSAFNIPEPIDGIKISTDQIDIVFVPLLTFDKLGNRVGYGKGFYDRFLALCNPETIKIGLSFFEAENEFTDITEADIKLDYCITPKQIYSF